jgi:hypothetical protein
MERLLAYLDAFNEGEGTIVAGITAIKGGVRIERSTREGDSFDLCDRYVAQAHDGISDVDERDCRETGGSIAIHRMGPNGFPDAEDENRYLGSDVDCPAKQ